MLFSAGSCDNLQFMARIMRTVAVLLIVCLLINSSACMLVVNTFQTGDISQIGYKKGMTSPILFGGFGDTAMTIILSDQYHKGGLTVGALCVLIDLFLFIIPAIQD